MFYSLKMSDLSKQTFMSLEYKNHGKSYFLPNFVRLLFFLSLYTAIFSVSSIELQNSNRGREIGSKSRRDNDKYDSLVVTSRPNWWQKKVDGRPAFAVNDEPIGTGVPIWKEVDIYGVDSRRGRSFSNAFKDEHKSSALVQHLISSLLMFTICLNLLF